jgi:hypothetical protein
MGSVLCGGACAGQGIGANVDSGFWVSTAGHCTCRKSRCGIWRDAALTQHCGPNGFDDLAVLNTDYQAGCVAKARQTLRQAGKAITRSQIITELNFGFWSALFGRQAHHLCKGPTPWGGLQAEERSPDLARGVGTLSRRPYGSEGSRRRHDRQLSRPSRATDGDWLDKPVALLGRSPKLGAGNDTINGGAPLGGGRKRGAFLQAAGPFQKLLADRSYDADHLRRALTKRSAEAW